MSLVGAAAGALTGNIGLWVAGGLLAAGVTAFGVQTYRLNDAEADAAQARAAYATREADLERMAREAEQREREREHAWAQRQQEITDVTTKRLQAADAAASAADAAARGLRDRAQAVAAAGRRACPSAALAAGGAAAADPIGMLADVLGRADARAGFLAAEADRRRERALACEAAYEVIRDKQSQAAAGAP